ncbi:MAG: hypothetical protein H0V62_02965 [Gammaproteobacteria bacterium]|nr:hypothetical protein [Gammaproteobacteria bacterium]
MSWRDKVVEALRTGFVLNERVMELAKKVERLDDDVRTIDRRLVRMETLVELAGRQQRLSGGAE